LLLLLLLGGRVLRRVMVRRLLLGGGLIVELRFPFANAVGRWPYGCCPGPSREGGK
jgi:hypothetical protein